MPIAQQFTFIVVPIPNQTSGACCWFLSLTVLLSLQKRCHSHNLLGILWQNNQSSRQTYDPQSQRMKNHLCPSKIFSRARGTLMSWGVYQIAMTSIYQND